jgi:competence protein ComGF
MSFMFFYLHGLFEVILSLAVISALALFFIIPILLFVYQIRKRKKGSGDSKGA